MNNNQLYTIHQFLESYPKVNYSEKILLFKRDLPDEFKMSYEYPLEFWNHIINSKLQNNNNLLLDDIKELNMIGYDLLEKSDESIILFIFDLKVIFKLFSFEFLDEVMLNCDGYKNLVQILVLENVNIHTKLFLLNFLFDLMEKNVLENSFFSNCILYASNFVHHLELKNMANEFSDRIGEATIKLTNQLFYLYPQNKLLSLICENASSVTPKIAMFLVSNINHSVIKQILSNNSFSIDNYKKEISNLFKICLYAFNIGPDKEWKKRVLSNIHEYSTIILQKINNDINSFNELIMNDFSTIEVKNWENIVINETI